MFPSGSEGVQKQNARLKALRRAWISYPRYHSNCGSRRPFRLSVKPFRPYAAGSGRFYLPALSSFRLRSDSLQALPAAHTNRRVSDRRNLFASPSRPLTGVYPFPPSLSTAFLYICCITAGTAPAAARFPRTGSPGPTSRSMRNEPRTAGPPCPTGSGARLPPLRLPPA